MFVSLEEEDQKDVATKWYHRVVKEKDIRHYQLLAKYTKEENQTLKKRLKDFQKESQASSIGLFKVVLSQVFLPLLV